ncbi:hypothetical protein [Streptomyces sp. MMG1121]|uniref:hypothetical protein n=1 Tax=Streptomyces sp. MMG1121 TaxID=1415544 RepID=UPI0006ADEEDE|nr:hypothetical protein [Streptomyces sp. MMG1121]
MRAIRVASSALLGVGVLALTVPVLTPAVAGDDGHDVTPLGFRLAPSSITAGGKVNLRLDRDGGCRGTATVSSGVFDTVRIPPERSSATAVVDRDAKPEAAYSVTYRCDGVSGSTDLTIADGHGDGRSDSGNDGRSNSRNDSGNDSRSNSGNDSRSDSGNNGRSNSGNDSGNDGRSNSRSDSGNDGRSDSRSDSGNDSRSDDQYPDQSRDSSRGESRDQSPDEPFQSAQHGVRAGAGGSIAGFDLKEIGLGAALIAGSLGTAYHFARRRADEDGG